MTDIADKIYAATGLTLGAEAAAKIGQMIQQAKRDALAEAEIAAKKAGERHQEIARRIGFEPTIDGAIGHACADIRDLKDEGDD
jgi:hypothetical protein